MGLSACLEVQGSLSSACRDLDVTDPELMIGGSPRYQGPQCEASLVVVKVGLDLAVCQKIVSSIRFALTFPMIRCVFRASKGQR